MAAGITDKITDVRNAARPNSARVSSGRSAGGATLACDNLAGWPTASKVHFVTYTIDSNSSPVAGTQLDCYGIVSGNNITSFTVVDGTDTGNSVNDVVEMLPTAAWGQDLADALTSQHSRTGAHGVVTATSVAATGAVTAASVTASGAMTGATATTSGAATLNSVVTNTIGASGANHVAISAGTSKLVKTSVLRQDDTTNTYQQGNTVTLTGWGVVVPGVANSATEAVTFGVTFTQPPIVLISSGGDNASAATYGSGGSGAVKKFGTEAASILTTGFTAYVWTQAGDNWSAGNTVFYQWIAIGEI